MRTCHIFIIESDSSTHRLFVDGTRIGTFPTLATATSEATDMARRFMPSTPLRFELEFKWALSDSEIRAATLDCPGNSR
jgi:hypothetical protein